MIYTNDHRPPHVHVLGSQEHARFEPLCEQGRVRLMSSVGFSLSQIQPIGAYLVEHLAHLCNEWRKIHGH